MKYLIVSDIHGSIYYIDKVMKIFDKYNYDKIIILGDILYHGPRNNLPKLYRPKKVIELLNKYQDKIIAINGNCDAEVDQMVLKFKIEPRVNMMIDNKNIHLIHGHKYLDDKYESGDVIFYGHTHVHKFENKDGVYFINPGSISIPKNKQKHTFMSLDNNQVCLYDYKYNLLDNYLIK